MQKRIFTFLFLIATVLSYSTFAEAALQFLPRYQGGYGTRTQQGGRDKVCDSIYQYACSGTGYAGGVGTSCNDLYTSCNCSTNYKWSGGSCVLKSCSDYGYSASKDNTKSCEEKTPRSGLTCYVCTACDGSTYKYACSGGLNASTQGTTNKCGTNYSECSCVEHASWNSSSGKCECGSDYKAGTTSCTLKTCEDYGYSATEDTTKNCTKQTPRSGLACWNCSDCTGTLYDCSSMANASGADTSSASCGGKYAKCKCKDLYVWDNGVCKLGCTRNSCSTTTYPLTAQNAANASSYEKCTPSCSDESPRYKVSSCASGYKVNSNGSGCEDAHVHSYHCQPGYQETNEWGADADIYPKVCDCGEIAGNTLCYKGRHVHSFHCPTGSPYQEVNEWGADAETFPMYCDCGEKSSTLVCYKAPACGSEFIYNCEQLGAMTPQYDSCGGLSTYCECENGKHWNGSSQQCVINQYELEICTGITGYHQIGTASSVSGSLDISVYIDDKRVGTIIGPDIYGLPPHGGGDYWHPAEPKWVCKTFEVSGTSVVKLEHDIKALEAVAGSQICYKYQGVNSTWVNDNGYDYVEPDVSCEKGYSNQGRYIINGYYTSGNGVWDGTDVIKLKIEIPYSGAEGCWIGEEDYYC